MLSVLKVLAAVVWWDILLLVAIVAVLIATFAVLTVRDWAREKWTGACARVTFARMWLDDHIDDRIAGSDRRERISAFLVWESAEPISEVDEFIAEVLATTQTRSSS